MKSFKLKLLPENSKDSPISFNSVSSQEKSELYEKIAVPLNHRVIFCHPTTAADAKLTPLQPVALQIFNIECNGKKISTKQPWSCFVVVTLVKLPQNNVFVSQEGIEQHLLLPHTCICSWQEHLTQARVRVRRVTQLVPAQTITFQPDFDYDSGISRWSCQCLIMHKMGVKSAPNSGHPFLFCESSRIFVGNSLWKRYLTVTSVTPASDHSVHPVLTLGPEGVYEAESETALDWEKLLWNNDSCNREKESKVANGGKENVVHKNTSKSEVGDPTECCHSNRKKCRKCRFSKNKAKKEIHKNGENSLLHGNSMTDSLNNTPLRTSRLEENGIDRTVDQDFILNSPMNTPDTKAHLKTSASQMLETPKSHNSSSKVFVHSISQSSFSCFESPSVSNWSGQNLEDTSDEELTLYYITPETCIELQSSNAVEDAPQPSLVDEETEPYYYNPQVQVLVDKLTICLSLLREIGRKQCLKVKCGVVVHGAPREDLEAMARRSARDLGLHVIDGNCDFSCKQEVRKLYDSARKKSPSMVVIPEGDVFLCDTKDGELSPAVSVLLEVMQSQWELRSAVVTVCLCDKIERLSSKVRKVLGFDVYNALPDVALRETIIRKVLESEDYLVQSKEQAENIDQNSNKKEKNYFIDAASSLSESFLSCSSASDAQNDQEKDTESADSVLDTQNVISGPQTAQNRRSDEGNKIADPAKGPVGKLTCDAEDITALAVATEYCSCSEVHGVVREKLMMQGSIRGGLPADFVPHLLSVNDSGFVPPTHWTDILGYSSLKGILQRMVQQYREDPEHCPLQGLFLYGPPGCSKTMFVKALATETNFSYFVVLGSVVLSKFVGGTEQLLRNVVQQAKASAPSIVFIDELESLCGDRGAGSSGAPMALLLELMSSCAPTPADPLTSVLFVGATNLPHLIDQDLLQAGYLTHVVHVGLPDCASRCAMWERLVGQVPAQCVEGDIDTRLLCRLTEGFSGAEIRGMFNGAGHRLMRADLSGQHAEAKKILTQALLVDAISATGSRIPASMLAAIDDFTASRSGVIEAS